MDILEKNSISAGVSVDFLQTHFLNLPASVHPYEMNSACDYKSLNAFKRKWIDEGGEGEIMWFNAKY